MCRYTLFVIVASVCFIKPTNKYAIYIYSLLTVVKTTKVYNKHTNNKEYDALLGWSNGTMIETS